MQEDNVTMTRRESRKMTRRPLSHARRGLSLSTFFLIILILAISRGTGNVLRNRHTNASEEFNSVFRGFSVAMSAVTAAEAQEEFGLPEGK